MRKIIISIFSFIAITSFAQETVKFAAGKHNDFGLAYNLPNTVVEVNIDVTKTSVKAGPYYKYAERYLGVQEIISQDLETYTINNIYMNAKGESNPEESYLIKFRSGSTPTMYLTKEGTLLSINAEPTYTTTNDLPELKKAAKAGQSAYYSVLSEEQLSAGSTAKMAEAAAKQIYRIRESRINLVTGEVDQLPADGESFKLIMKQLDDQEAALTEMFLGSTRVDQQRITIYYNPTENENKDVLFRFSKYLGVVDNDNLAGSPYYISVNITQDLRVEETPESLKAKKKNKNQGIAYIVPGKAEIAISSGNKVIKQQEMQFAQFGEVVQFPTNMFDDKKAPAKAQFNPETGAALEIVQ